MRRRRISKDKPEFYLPSSDFNPRGTPFVCIPMTKVFHYRKLRRESLLGAEVSCRLSWWDGNQWTTHIGHRPKRKYARDLRGCNISYSGTAEPKRKLQSGEALYAAAIQTAAGLSIGNAMDLDRL